MKITVIRPNGLILLNSSSPSWSLNTSIDFIYLQLLFYKKYSEFEDLLVNINETNYKSYKYYCKIIISNLLETKCMYKRFSFKYLRIITNLISVNSSVYAWLIMRGIYSTLFYVSCQNTMFPESLKYFSFSIWFQVDSKSS